MPRTVANPQGAFTIWRDPVGDSIAAGAFWDEHLRAAMDAADPDGLAIDVGANVGFHTVYLARRFKHVLALEAHPSTYQLLCQNIAANGVAARVTALQFAAYDKTTTLHMASPLLLGWQVPSETDLDLCGGAASLAFVPNGRGLSVPTVTVAAPFARPMLTVAVDARAYLPTFVIALRRRSTPPPRRDR